MTTWRFHPLNDAALLAEVTPADDTANRLVLALTAQLDQATPGGVLETVPAFNTLLVCFDPMHTSHAALIERLQALCAQLTPTAPVPARVLELPVRYGGEDGPDLPEVARRLGLSEAEVVRLHCAPIYRVLFLGFAPGFPYLGPLPERLRLPRRATPRTRVPAGTVAMAADMTGIYPAPLPGGWHLLGRTPLTLFDPQAVPPTLLQPGDGVRFVPLAEGVQP